MNFQLVRRLEKIKIDVAKTPSRSFSLIGGRPPSGNIKKTRASERYIVCYQYYYVGWKSNESLLEVPRESIHL